MNYLRVAGVTFNNLDGQSRQTILRDICGFGYHYALLRQTIYNDERAVEVWINSKMIGYVPKSELNNPMSYEQILIAQIGENQDDHVCWAMLSPIIPPSDKDIAVINSFCMERNIDPPIVKDLRAYRLFMIDAQAFDASQIYVR